MVTKPFTLPELERVMHTALTGGFAGELRAVGVRGYQRLLADATEAVLVTDTNRRPLDANRGARHAGPDAR